MKRNPRCSSGLTIETQCQDLKPAYKYDRMLRVAPPPLRPTCSRPLTEITDYKATALGQKEAGVVWREDSFTNNGNLCFTKWNLQSLWIKFGTRSPKPLSQTDIKHMSHASEGIRWTPGISSVRKTPLFAHPSSTFLSRADVCYSHPSLTQSYFPVNDSMWYEMINDTLLFPWGEILLRIWPSSPRRSGAAMTAPGWKCGFSTREPLARLFGFMWQPLRYRNLCSVLLAHGCIPPIDSSPPGFHRFTGVISHHRHLDFLVCVCGGI